MPSGAGPSTAGNRNRSGSASAAGEKKDPKEVFQDLAVQGKKGFNAIMQRLGGDRDREKEREKEKERDGDGFVMVNPSILKEDDGLQRRGTGRGAGKSGGETSALRGVRLKREADEAGELSAAPGRPKCSVAWILKENSSD